MATDHKPAQVASEHRLHISGLTPQISPADLKERFQRFGDVQKVDAVGPDALGKLHSIPWLISNSDDLHICRSTEKFRLFDDQCEAAGSDKMYVLSISEYRERPGLMLHRLKA
jgi:hypothetical protein